jgi:hypothetical protein
MESSLQTTSLSTRNRQRKHSDCWPWNRHWSMSDADVWSRQRQRIHERRIKPIAKIDSSLTHGFVKHTMSHSRTRNHLWKLSHGWRMEWTAHTNSWLMNEINRENRVIWRMKSLVKTASQPTRNRQQKQSDWWPWNRQSSMSDSWRMESTALKNSRATHITDCKNRFMFDAWNRQTHYASADP